MIESKPFDHYFDEAGAFDAQVFDDMPLACRSGSGGIQIDIGAEALPVVALYALGRTGAARRWACHRVVALWQVSPARKGGAHAG